MRDFEMQDRDLFSRNLFTMYLHSFVKSQWKSTRIRICQEKKFRL